jgi:hypothetical protein
MNVCYTPQCNLQDGAPTAGGDRVAGKASNLMSLSSTPKGIFHTPAPIPVQVIGDAVACTQSEACPMHPARLTCCCVWQERKQAETPNTIQGCARKQRCRETLNHAVGCSPVAVSQVAVGTPPEPCTVRNERRAATQQQTC